MYLSHDPEEQRRIFLKRGMSVEADARALRNGEKVMQWCFPLGFVKWKPKVWRHIMTRFDFCLNPAWL